MYIEDIFRTYWAHGLNNITLNNSDTFNDWIKKGKDYQMNLQCIMRWAMLLILVVT